MALEIVGERTERRGRARQFPHRVDGALRQRRIRLQRVVGRDERVVRSGQRGTNLRCDLSVERLEQTVRVGQRLVQVVADGFERNLVQFRDEAGDRVLQPLQVARNGRQFGWTLAPVHRRLQSSRKEIYGDIKLARQEARRFQLGAQTVSDQILDERLAIRGDPAAISGRFFLRVGVIARGEALGENTYHDRNAELLFDRVKVRIDRRHFAHNDAPEIDGRADRQAAYRLLEVQHIGVDDGVVPLHRLGTVAEELELTLRGGFGLDGLVGHVWRILECQAANQDRYQ